MDWFIIENSFFLAVISARSSATCRSVWAKFNWDDWINSPADDATLEVLFDGCTVPGTAFL